MKIRHGRASTRCSSPYTPSLSSSSTSKTTSPTATGTSCPPAQQGQQILHLDWSRFQPDLSGKPNEDAEACLLHTNDWMNSHHFEEGVKVQRFCLTFLAEARLWYQSLEPINVDWQGLQILFRQQYSKIGNTR